MGYEKLEREILRRSVSKTFKEAVKEWKLVSISTIPKDESASTCLCGHSPIREVCFLGYLGLQKAGPASSSRGDASGAGEDEDEDVFCTEAPPSEGQTGEQSSNGESSSSGSSSSFSKDPSAEQMQNTKNTSKSERELAENEVEVGNCCVKKFFDLPSDKIFTALKRIETDPSASANTETLDYALEKGWINQQTYDFYFDTKGKRQSAEHNKNVIAARQRVNKRLIDFFKKKSRGGAYITVEPVTSVTLEQAQRALWGAELEFFEEKYDATSLTQKQKDWRDRIVTKIETADAKRRKVSVPIDAGSASGSVNLNPSTQPLSGAGSNAPSFFTTHSSEDVADYLRKGWINEWEKERLDEWRPKEWSLSEKQMNIVDRVKKKIEEKKRNGAGNDGSGGNGHTFRGSGASSAGSNSTSVNSGSTAAGFSGTSNIYTGSGTTSAAPPNMGVPSAANAGSSGSGTSGYGGNQEQNQKIASEGLKSRKINQWEHDRFLEWTQKQSLSEKQNNIFQNIKRKLGVSP